MSISGGIQATTEAEANTLADVAAALGYQEPSSASPAALPAADVAAKAGQKGKVTPKAKTQAKTKSGEVPEKPKVKKGAPVDVQVLTDKGELDEALMQQWMRQLNADITDGCKWKGTPLQSSRISPHLSTLFARPPQTTQHNTHQPHTQ